MTRPEAVRLVRERWERLGIGTPEEFPHVFSSDVDNMLAWANLPDVNEAINQALEPQSSQSEHPPRCMGHYKNLQRVLNTGDGVSGGVDGHALPIGAAASCTDAMPSRFQDREHPQSEYQASPADSQVFHSSLDHFTNRITRCVDKKLGRETEYERNGR